MQAFFSIFAPDWETLIGSARIIATVLEFPARVLRGWADGMDSELDREFERTVQRERRAETDLADDLREQEIRQPRVLDAWRKQKMLAALKAA